MELLWSDQDDPMFSLGFLALAVDHMSSIDTALQRLEAALEEGSDLPDARDDALLSLNHQGMHLDFNVLQGWYM